MPGTLNQKVQRLFRDMAGERAAKLATAHVANDVMKKVAKALRSKFPEEAARDIAFHLSDWHSDAAFIVALHLFPECFTAKEIREGVTAFLIHAPNHIAAAAKLADWPIEDLFGVSALDGRHSWDDPAPSSNTTTSRQSKPSQPRPRKRKKH